MGTEQKKSAAKDLLLEDFRYLSDSFWKNEQTGETRVNIFIGIVTLVVGGLVSFVTSERFTTMPTEHIRLIMIASLAALLMLGLITLARIIKRNESADQYKNKLDQIRQIFKDHFDGDQVLSGYNIQQQKRRSKKSDKRKFGGLSHLIAGINSILIGGIAGAVFYQNQVMDIRIYLTITLAFIFGFALQFLFINESEHKSKKKRMFRSPTHAGGVVYSIMDGKTGYWLVESMKNPGEWVLPKGHIKEAEDHAEAALREVQEETGIVAQIMNFLDTIEYGKIRAKYYLMSKKYDIPEHEKREINLFSYTEALTALKHPENRYILEKARIEILKLGIKMTPRAKFTRYPERFEG